MEQHLYRVTYILKEERIDEKSFFIFWTIVLCKIFFNQLQNNKWDGTDRIRGLVSAAKPEGDLNLKSKIIFN